MKFGYLGEFSSDTDVEGAEAFLKREGRPVDNMDMSDLDLVVLFGGQDISTGFYGQKPVKAMSGPFASKRDIREVNLVVAAQEHSVPILGICRGAQLLCALLGGKLWQHVDNHEGKEHEVIVKGEKYKTNSYHHQLMIPHPRMEVIGYTPCKSRIKWGEEAVVDEGDEAEIVYDPRYRALMIQGHPEWVNNDHDLFKLTQQLLKERLCIY